MTGAGALAACVAAVGFAFAAGAQACFAWSRRRRRRTSYREAFLHERGLKTAAEKGGGVAESVVRLAVIESMRGDGAVQYARLLRRTAQWVEAHAGRAGLADLLSPEGGCRTRSALCAVCAAAGAVLGTVFSGELAFLLGVAGALLGWAALPWAVRQRERKRADELERHLSEMLEVVSMGMRSGLSFDRALELYGSHFDTLLAMSCESARRKWTTGLSSREAALRELAASYDSLLLERVVEDIVRSLRFGSSLADSLGAAAVETRAVYRARRQEQVAKAPVKMMVPTGALMLPAMLMLVLGPVMLELMEGF